MTDRELAQIGEALLKLAAGFDEMAIALANVDSRLTDMRAVYEAAVGVVMAETYGHEDQ